MRILILGGTRFIGPDVVRHLVGDGHAVTIFHRGETEAEGLPDVAHIHGDRTRLGDYRAEFEHAAPEVVIDMRPVTGADATAVMGRSGGSPAGSSPSAAPTFTVPSAASSARSPDRQIRCR